MKRSQWSCICSVLVLRQNRKEWFYVAAKMCFHAALPMYKNSCVQPQQKNVDKYSGTILSSLINNYEINLNRCRAPKCLVARYHLI
jgi:hypothetical protein